MTNTGSSPFGRFRAMLGPGKSAVRSHVAAKVMTGQEREQAILLLRDYEASGLGWFWSSDSQGQITYISQCVADQLGCETASMLGQSVQTLFILDRDDDDPIERSRLRPTGRTVSELEMNVANAFFIDALKRLVKQRFDALDGPHLTGQMRENGGLVAAPGADLQHAVLRLHISMVRHERHDVRL